MLGEVMFRDIAEKPADRDQRDVVRMGMKVMSDIIVVTMYRRGMPNRQDPSDNTVTLRVLTEAADIEEASAKDKVSLDASVSVDLGDFAEAVALTTSSAARRKARKKVHAKSNKQEEADARFEAQRITAEAALAKFNKLYGEHEQTTAKLVDAEAEVRGLRASIEMLLAKAREDGHEISLDVLKQAAEAKAAADEIVAAVGAPGDAEDLTT